MPLVQIETEGERREVKAVPDAWLLFERPDGKRASILVEIDRGREYGSAFKAHVAARTEFIASGQYERVFGTPGVTIAYTTTGERPEYVERRLASMRQWTKEVLSEQGRQNWAELFRFCSLSLDSARCQRLCRARSIRCANSWGSRTIGPSAPSAALMSCKQPSPTSGAGSTLQRPSEGSFPRGCTGC
jgi:hypothetical protein